jgi:DNA repair protein RadA/Sms
MVDTVLYFEGDRHASYRVLRGVKNRFGSTNEIGVFEMREQGLVEVENASEYMLSGRPEQASGSVVACCMEGTRPILIEVQSLVCHTNFGIPRRQAIGADFNRLNLLMAVLEKRTGLRLADCDAYVNVTGGMKITEPAIDLAIVLAVASSFKNSVLDPHVLVFGEVGLSGEVRAVSQARLRVQEAERLGFTQCVVPEVCAADCRKNCKIEVIGVKTVQDAIDRLL